MINMLYANAQPISRAFLGIGAGLDYGGFGIRAEIQPLPHVGLFGGVGYNLLWVGYNGGVSVKLLTKGRVQPVVVGMYGYNGVIRYSGAASVLSQSYYGFSVGAGYELYDKRNRSKLLLEILVPIRSQEFRDDYDFLRSNSTSYTGILPVTFSIGYNFNLFTKYKKVSESTTAD